MGLPSLTSTYTRPVCDQATAFSLVETDAELIDADIRASKTCSAYMPEYRKAEYVHPSEKYVWSDLQPGQVDGIASCPGTTYPYALDDGRVTCCCGNGCC